MQTNPVQLQMFYPRSGGRQPLPAQNPIHQFNRERSAGRGADLFEAYLMQAFEGQVVQQGAQLETTVGAIVRQNLAQLSREF